jgi:hypothetical protein
VYLATYEKIILFITLVSTLSAVSQNAEFKTIAINTVNIIEMTLLVMINLISIITLTITYSTNKRCYIR